VADETASTTNSDQTATTQQSDAAADTAADKGADKSTEQTADQQTDKQDEGDSLGSTALGNDPKPAEGEGDAPKAAEVPETYELTVPEGFEKLDADALAAATPVFKELGLSNEQANKLMPVAGEFAKKIIAERDQQFLGTILEQRKAWLNDAKADKEIGGSNWDATMQDSARALDRLGFPKGSPLRSALDESGFGNHPEMIRLIARVGKAVGEDSDFVRSDANAAVKPKDDRELFYPGSTDRK
jgi:hypothetical protein